MPERMCARERLLAAFRSQPVDRAPVKIWGATPWREVWHRSYQPILDLALEMTDLVGSWGLDEGYFMTSESAADLEVSERAHSGHPGYHERTTLCRTRLGELRAVEAVSPSHLPSYTLKYPVETVEDARRFLAVPYSPIRGDVSDYFAKSRLLGDRGIVVASIGIEPIYGVQMLMGSELLGVWLLQERDLVRELTDCLARRVIDRVEYLLSKGVGPVFGYVGPEVCIPPLARPQDFDEFVVRTDARFVRPIKEAGGLLWVHCHGAMRSVIQGFRALGVDCLNPIEPPPMGDVTLRQARDLVGSDMCLEGNVEDGELRDAPPGRVRELVRQAIHDSAGGGFILCPSASFMLSPVAEERFVRNYREYVQAGLEFGTC